MKNKPLLSYVLTAYNCEAFIAESIRCAFAQTYTPMEIILSDDCSADNTYRIMQHMAEEYQGPHRVVLNRNAENVGITRHMNKAYLELASGNYILAAHGDDRSLSNRAEISAQFLTENPDVYAVSGGLEAVYCDEDGTETPAVRHSCCVNDLHLYTLESLANPPAPSRCFRREVMTRFGPLQDSCPTEDELISFRALLLGKVAFLPDKMVTYRKHQGSSSSSKNFGAFPLQKIMEQQLLDMEEAVRMKLLMPETAASIQQQLQINLRIRTLYRRYFAKRNLANFLQLLLSPDINWRCRLSYIYEHWRYLSTGSRRYE